WIPRVGLLGIPQLDNDAFLVILDPEKSNEWKYHGLAMLFPFATVFRGLTSINDGRRIRTGHGLVIHARIPSARLCLFNSVVSKLLIENMKLPVNRFMLLTNSRSLQIPPPKDYPINDPFRIFKFKDDFSWARASSMFRGRFYSFKEQWDVQKQLNKGVYDESR
ncbi:MAG: hypothetical protein ACTSXP_10195, partial [Promethearchaeota archaeon]